MHELTGLIATVLVEYFPARLMEFGSEKAAAGMQQRYLALTSKKAKKQ